MARRSGVAFIRALAFASGALRLTANSKAQGPKLNPAPIVIPAGVTVERAVPFSDANGTSLLADLYLPSQPGKHPGIVFLHGGGWRAGERTQLQRQAIYMAQQGYVGMAPDYRLAPSHIFPAALDDARAAVVWLRVHAKQYSVNPAMIAAVGSSAGGHLAALLGVETNPAQPQPGDVEAVVAFNGIYDLAAMPAGTMVSYFIGADCVAELERCSAASPIHQIGRGGPPFLLLHGTADVTAPYAQATTFSAALTKAGYQVKLFTAQDAPHTFWIQKKWMDPSFAAMSEFLQSMMPAKLP